MEVKAIKTLYEMLFDRGFKFSYVDYNYENKENYVIKAVNTDLPETKIIYCFICPDEKLNIKVVKDKICFSKKNSSGCIIVYKDSVTTIAKKSIESLDIDIELFSINELQFNITRHRLVPKHIKLMDEIEIDNMKKYKLPFILSSDPISRYYKFNKGDIIKIIRKNGIIAYRQVKKS